MQSRCVLAGAVAAAIGIAAAAADAVTLLAPLGSPVYVESFNGETAFPTMPDTNTAGQGAMVLYQVGSPLPTAPTFTGTRIQINAVESAGAAGLQGVGGRVPISGFTSGKIGLYGRFDSFSVVPDNMNGAFQTAAVTLFDSTLNNGASAYLLDFQNQLLRVVVSNLTFPFQGYAQVSLTTTADAAIRGGAAFELELLFDNDANTAQAALKVGSEYFQTPATTAATFTSMTAIDGALGVNTSTNNAAPTAQIATRLDQYEIYGLPEPSGIAMGLAGVALIAVSPRARSRRARGADPRRCGIV